MIPVDQISAGMTVALPQGITTVKIAVKTFAKTFAKTTLVAKTTASLPGITAVMNAETLAISQETNAKTVALTVMKTDAKKVAILRKKTADPTTTTATR
jgi:hypothetical protein